MKKYFYVCLALGFMFLFPAAANAECSNERKAELSKIAGNVQFSYNYGDYAFSVDVTNITNDIYVKDEFEEVIISGVFEKQLSYYSGTTVNFGIYSNDRNCPNELLLTKNITIPEYNAFANSEECQTNPEFKYCQKWLSSSLSGEQFDNELQKYINDNDQKLYNHVNELSFVDNVFEFLEENKIIIVIILGLLIVVLINYILKIIRKKRLGGVR